MRLCDMNATKRAAEKSLRHEQVVEGRNCDLTGGGQSRNDLHLSPRRIIGRSYESDRRAVHKREGFSEGG